MMAAGLCERHTPSGVALRTYVRHPGLAASIRQLQFVWHPRMRGGYGWIFPGPDGVFNIGAGHPGSHIQLRSGKGHMQNLNLRRFFEGLLRGLRTCAAADARRRRCRATMRAAALLAAGRALVARRAPGHR
ncbi:MAG: hypothetical protein U1F67_05380 [Rubrivivax sp.]